MILIAGRTGNSKALSSPVPVRVKIHGHHPNEHKMGNETTPKLILLPNSVEDLFSVAGMTNLTTFDMHAFHGKGSLF